MRIVTVIGNRPQFVKAAAVSRLLREHHEEVLVHTGQHYDDELSRVFFDELGVPAPDRELGVGGGLEHRPDGAHPGGAGAGAGRAASPTSCSSTATRTRRSPARWRPRRRACRSAHVEAGMRSFDRSMPEELNRVLTDHASDLLLCSTETAVRNLRARGTSAARSSWSAT